MPITITVSSPYYCSASPGRLAPSRVSRSSDSSSSERQKATRASSELTHRAPPPTPHPAQQHKDTAQKASRPRSRQPAPTSALNVCMASPGAGSRRPLAWSARRSNYGHPISRLLGLGDAVPQEDDRRAQIPPPPLQEAALAHAGRRRGARATDARRSPAG